MWNPQDDVDQSFAYSSPEEQNRVLIGRARNARTTNAVLPEWADYDAVLKGRGVGALRGFNPGPSIEDDPYSTFNTNQEGPRPWGMGALEGLRKAVKPGRV